MMIRRLFLATAAVGLLLALPTLARAVTIQGVAHNVPYVIAFHPLNSSAHPYVGQLHLNFNNGIVSGTYTDLSNKPGSPFANGNNLPVSGNTSGSQVTLVIRQVTFRGTISGNTMSGSATIRGSIYTFHAQQGTPGSGR
jgi:hypothetical protein